MHQDHFQIGRRVALLGYDMVDKDTCLWGLPRLGHVLHHSFTKMGCHIASLQDAEVVVLDGRMEEAAPDVGERSLHHWLDKIGGRDIVILVAEDHEAHPDVLARERELGKQIRRYRKPITPTILREILFPDHSRHITAKIQTANGGSYDQPVNSPDQMDAHGNEIHSNNAKSGLRFDESTIEVQRPCRLSAAITGISSLWKPKGMPVEEAVASLCLGDYFSSRRKGSLGRSPSSVSAHSRDKSHEGTPTLVSGDFSDVNSTPAMSMNTPSDDRDEMDFEPEPEPENIKVMVVEDNMINRKILVKILSTKLNIEVIEAEDGSIAVEKFKKLNSPAISMSLPIPRPCNLC
jgi:hypothetical protein